MPNAMDATQHELRYVHAVYEAIGDHFNATRYRAWPQVDAFLERHAHGVVVFDNGAGNGKYALSVQRQHGYYIAGDRCRRLLRYARWQSDSRFTGDKEQVPFECVQADCLLLPFRSEVLDIVLSIAVIHHIATSQRRAAALIEMRRVLRTAGRGLVYVWAQQAVPARLRAQAQTTTDGLLLPWHRKFAAPVDRVADKSESSATTYLRYYHLFEDTELRQLVETANASSQDDQKEGYILQICREEFDHQNYVIEFEKETRCIIEDIRSVQEMQLEGHVPKMRQ
ncbi:hypothetical protein CCYA_CCYA12G3357 [Cyanidiococcus yangmingshanensis]|nr:hypothetical protein CCYA_CCYA12G3357 [Cyanidiococcus yangmingshanensis]